MTKEELAEEYIKSNNLEWKLNVVGTSPIGEIKQAYIAGLKEGIEQVQRQMMSELGDAMQTWR